MDYNIQTSNIEDAQVTQAENLVNTHTEAETEKKEIVEKDLMR